MLLMSSVTCSVGEVCLVIALLTLLMQVEACANVVLVVGELQPADRFMICLRRLMMAR